MATATKPATVTTIARIVFKNDSRKVCYLVRSSDGKSQYTTCLFEGRATSCTCPSRKPCKHMKAAEEAEQARNAPRPYTSDEIAALVAKLDEAEQEQSSLDDMEYARWKKEHGLDGPMTSEEIENIARYELAYVA